jgi:ATP-binding cassette subfamily C protein
MVFLEIVGVASILPFMELVAKPDAIEQSSWLALAYDLFNFESRQELLIAMGMGIVALIGITSCVSILTTWMQYKYSWDTAHNLSVRLLNSYLKKPYAYFLNVNTGDLQAYIIGEVGNLTSGVIIPLIEIISRTLVAVILFGLLLLVDTQIALIMFGSLGSAYLIIYLARQNFLKRIGQYRIDMNMLRFKNLREVLSGIKTVKVYNEERFFYERFRRASQEFCDVQPRYNLILDAPRYLLEFLAFGTILGVTVVLYSTYGNIQSAIPRLSLYAVAGYRLLPALQKAFAAAAKMRHNLPVLDRLYENLVSSRRDSGYERATDAALPFQKEIYLKAVSFQYENTDQAVIKSLDLSIPKGQTVAFVGATGSGKSTLIDLIVGLLEPSRGQINIDDTVLTTENTRAWQQKIAYVPQDVFLFDDTVACNIAIGQEAADMDLEQMSRAARLADIYDFIQTELKDGFQSEIGENGVRLSGGQRQRLGLARALYRNPAVLVLDEATSALDSITEKGIIDSLNTFPTEITTIIIAHRLSTVRHADRIYIMSEGNITAAGTYEDLMESNHTFQTMVKLS